MKLKFKFWEKRDAKACAPAVKEEDYLPKVQGGLLSGLFGSNISATSLSSVFAAVEMISNSIAELPVYVKTLKEGKTEIIKDHVVNKVLDSGEMTKFMLFKCLITDVLLHGDGLIYILRDSRGVPMKLHYCPFGSYTIYRKSNYIGEELTIYRLNNLRKAKNVEPIDVIHIFKNTENGYQGKGVLDYALNCVLLAAFAEKSASNFFRSGCHVSGILSTSSPKLSNLARKDIRDAWIQAHGAANSNGVAVLEAGMQYLAVGTNSRDAQLLESRLYSLQEIARFFNINPTLLGDLSKSSYSTIESANLEFATHTLMPLITLLQEELKRKLLMPTEKDLYIDVDETYLIKADKAATSSYLSTLVSSGIITINEARRNLGYNEIEGGDVNIIPFTKLDDNKVENLDKNIVDLHE